MKRTQPLRRATPLRASSPLRRSPMRRAAAMPDPVPEASRAAVAARSGGRCEVCGVRPATDVHHRQRRREGGHAVENLLHLCREDHRDFHEHPVAARLGGWIVSVFGDPAVTPVCVRGRWVLLTGDGRYRDAGRVA